jgi:hypothetical protein
MSTSSHSLDASVPLPSTPVQSPDPLVSAEVFAAVARLGLGEQFPEVIALTRELFGDFTIEISEDPEIYNCSYVTFVVRTDGTVDEMVQMESEWISRLPRWPTQAPGSFCINAIFVS